MKIDTSTKAQNNSPFCRIQNTSRGKKASDTFKLDLSAASVVTTTQNLAGDAEITGLMQAINEEITEMTEKLRNGEVKEKFQTGSTSFTNEEWEQLLKKFDISEDAVKKATVEKSQNTTETNQEQASEDNQLLQQTSENTGIDIIARLYKQYKG